MLKKCVLKWLCDFFVFQNDKKLSNGFKKFLHKNISTLSRTETLLQLNSILLDLDGRWVVVKSYVSKNHKN